MEVVISGASGMVGRALAAFLEASGHTVYPLIRPSSRLPISPRAIVWNPEMESIPLDLLEGKGAVVHLAGAPITRRWTRAVREEMFLSRVRDTWLLAHALTRLRFPPPVLFVASAVGFYGDRGEEELTEESPPGHGFLPTLCRKWEEASMAVAERGIRIVHGRFGVVLSPHEGMLGRLWPWFRWGLGGRLGTGQQWVSWIALPDLVHAISFLLKRDDLSGPFNCTAPHPVRNRELTEHLARAARRRPFFPAPAPLLRLALGEMASEVLLSSARVLPERLLQNGFRFAMPDLPCFNSDSSFCVDRKQ
jgi:hypothetical protein